MDGTVVYWHPKRKLGRIKADADGRTYGFRKAWVAAPYRDREFRRGERVRFRGDETRKGRKALDVAPL